MALRRNVTACVLLLMLAGCARVGPPPTLGGRPPKAFAAVVAAATLPTDVGRVVCERDKVVLEDPVVRPRQDGVHILIDDPGGAWGVEFHHESMADGTAEGVQLKDMQTPDTSAMGPGTVVVGCLPSSHSSYNDPGVPTAELTIVDPDGLYVPWDLSCGFGEQFRMTIAASPNQDPAVMFRSVPGVQPSDELKTPNYPGSPQFWPTYIVIRDGAEIARIGAPEIGQKDWQLLVNACPGSGITKS